MREEPHARDVKVKFIFGPPGTGKSHYVEQNVEYKDLFWFSPQPSAVFFDGYTDQSVIVLDDFIGSHCPRNLLLRLLDKYPMRLPVKGGTRVARYETVYVTSNYWPSEWYQDQSNLWAIQRRIHEVILKLSRESDYESSQPVSQLDWYSLQKRVGK